MKIARAATPDGVKRGEYDPETETLDAAEGTYDVTETDLLAPCSPSAMYCVGRNYAKTIEQMDYERPEEPTFFIKPPVSIHPPGAPITYPSFTEELTYAGELAAVIGERCGNLSEEDVDDAVLGYTIMNDLDALDQPNLPARKAFNSSGPLGPWIETDVEPVGLDVHTDVGGERRQESNTELMLFKPREVISFLSERFTFRPGDVIAFGSPANPGLVEPGESVEITYEGIGTLRNTIVDG